MKRSYAGALLLLLIAVQADAQSLSRRVTDGHGRTRSLPDPDEVIIELAAVPLLAPGAGPAADLDRLLDRLEREVAAVERTRISASSPHTAVLRHRYTHTFVGAAARLGPAAVAQIRKLGYVRRVHPDRVVTALLQQSVEQVGAPVVWQEHGARGEGVVVAVIDSGIDYAHPALGGGMGPAFKVVGGRDFVNNDGDPMDDHGHGTHVAAIVAANGGGLTGVAPDASLLAYKALDASGSGRDSWVLAAVEEAARQGADVVNMSLGRPAAADDPVVRAVENAAAAGVIFCVAAGNSGQFLDIGAPGNAPSAITVGAIDREGRLAPFSSKGPVLPTGSIKPEVVAPGVGIVSARNGGGTRTASGTSMAAPHVAGVAALLRDAHPEWSASRIRSALINGSRAVVEEVMAAGAGSVHAGDAAGKSLQPSHNVLSFGISDHARQPWTATRTITLTNRSGVEQNLTVTVDGLRDGIELVSSIASVTLGPGASTPVVLQLGVDHTKVPAPEAGSLSFGGHLRFAGEGGSISIPWGFVQARRVRVRWTGSSTARVRVATAKMMVAGSTTTSGAPVELFIGAGNASLWVEGEAGAGASIHQVIRENVDLSSGAEISVGPADAPYLVRFAGTDAHGRLLSDRGGRSTRDLMIVHPHFASDLLGSLVWLPTGRELFVSPLPPATRLLAFERAFDLDPPVTWCAQYEPLTAVDGEVELTVPAGAWKALSATTIAPPGLAEAHQSVFGTLWISVGHGTVSSIAGVPVEPPSRPGQAPIEAWITSSTASGSGTGVLVEIGEDADSSAGPFSGVEVSAEFTASEHGIVPGRDRTPRVSSRVIPPREPVLIGAGPAFPLGTVSVGFGAMAAAISWKGPLGEERPWDAKHTRATLYDAQGTVIAQAEPLPGAPGIPGFPGRGFLMSTPLPAGGAYTLEAWADSFEVDGRSARGTLRVAFDSTREDATPPALTSFRIGDGTGRTTAALSALSGATLTFSAVDLGMTSFADLRRERTSLHWRPHGSGEESWAVLTPVVVADDLDQPSSGAAFRFPDGVVHRVSLDTAGDSMRGAVDVRIAVEDASGNRAEYTLEPAFVVNAGRRRAVRQ